MKAENDKKGRKEETEQEEKDFPPLPLYKKKKKTKKKGEGRSARACTHEVLALCAMYIPPPFFSKCL